MSTVSGRVRLLGSGRRRWVRFVAAGVACAMLATLSPWVWSRSLGAIPLFLLLPGWTMAATSTGSRSRVAIVTIPALSVATTILCGLILALAHSYHPSTIVGAVLLVIVAVAGMTTDAEGPPDTRARRARPSTLGVALAVATPVMLATIIVAAIGASVTSANRDSAKARTVAVWAIRDNDGLSVGVVDEGVPKGPDVAITSGSERLARWAQVPLRDARWTAHLSLASRKCGAVTVTVSSRGHVDRVLNVGEGCTHG